MALLPLNFVSDYSPAILEDGVAYEETFASAGLCQCEVFVSIPLAEDNEHY